MKKTWSVLFLLLLAAVTVQAEIGILKGTIVDKQTGEPLMGATVQVVGGSQGVAADLDGRYALTIRTGVYDIVVKYVGYRSQEFRSIVVGQNSSLDVKLEAESQTLDDVTVTAQAKKNTEMALLSLQRRSLITQSGVSAQQIARTPDRDASEVIRCIPGISLIDGKFVMVRGLSQRYNNARLNGGAIPSSEADSRAFSFDLIPSSQLENMIVVKSPAPEYAADFTGGFVLIETKDIPTENSFSLGLQSGVNTEAHFRTFGYAKGSGTDFLGFDGGLRSLRGGMHHELNPLPGIPNAPDLRSADLLNNGLNNDWLVRHKRPMPDWGINMNLSRHLLTDTGKQWGLMATANYSNAYKTFVDMENSLFGAYDVTNDRSNYLRRAKDDQYNHDIRLGGMANLSFVPNSQSRYEWKNIFNLLGKERYTYRTGWDAQENRMESAEYYYSSRLTYNGQLSGRHYWGNDKLEWSAGYAFSGRQMPDRRRYARSDEGHPGTLALVRANDIRREYTDLKEHIWSGSLVYEHRLPEVWTLTPALRTGGYGEYRSRVYTTREFLYNWNVPNSLPSELERQDIPSEVLAEKNYGVDGIHLIEKPKWRNNYEGTNMQAAGYLGLLLPIGRLDVYAGLRFEHNRMTLIRHTRDVERSPQSLHYEGNDFFPSINVAYRLDERKQLRLSYGRSINRPEFREVSPSVFYDFELGSSVQGNTALKSAYADNFDLRYELYPRSGEQVSVAVFYKNFRSPIEWTYTMTGGETPIYSFHNADRAYSAGVEVDLRKDLDFIGLPHWSLSLNGSWINSMVTFDSGTERSRPMQGQSPYLINGGLFYKHPTWQLDASVLYNRIGKRIIGVGRTVGTVGGEHTVNIPDSYEMPRNTVDVSVSKRWGEKWLCRLSVRDVLGERVFYKQFTTVAQNSGQVKKLEEVTKSYRPGRQLSLHIGYTF